MKKKVLQILGSLTILSLLAVGVFLLASRSTPPATSPTDHISEDDPLPRAFPPHIVGDAKFYKSFILRFSVYFPKSLDVLEYGKADTSTIVFEDRVTRVGFQVFVVPQKGDSVSKDRFAMDVPSGVVLEPTDTIIDTVRALAFVSKDAILGDTYEVWFINNGFLYEVTTRLELREWLDSILTTWKFL